MKTLSVKIIGSTGERKYKLDSNDNKYEQINDKKTYTLHVRDLKSKYCSSSN